MSETFIELVFLGGVLFFVWRKPWARAFLAYMLLALDLFGLYGNFTSPDVHLTVTVCERGGDNCAFSERVMRTDDDLMRRGAEIGLGCLLSGFLVLSATMEKDTILDVWIVSEALFEYPDQHPTMLRDISTGRLVQAFDDQAFSVIRFMLIAGYIGFVFYKTRKAVAQASGGEMTTHSVGSTNTTAAPAHGFYTSCGSGLLMRSRSYGKVGTSTNPIPNTAPLLRAEPAVAATDCVDLSISPKSSPGKAAHSARGFCGLCKLGDFVCHC